MLERYKGPTRIRLDPVKLLALRKSRGNTLEDVAQACGVTRQAVSLWEQGRSVPYPATVAALKAFFGAELTSDILGLETWPEAR